VKNKKGNTPLWLACNGKFSTYVRIYVFLAAGVSVYYKAKRKGKHTSGMARILKGSQFYLHTPRSSTNRINHNCFFLPSPHLPTRRDGRLSWPVVCRSLSLCIPICVCVWSVGSCMCLSVYRWFCRGGTTAGGARCRRPQRRQPSCVMYHDSIPQGTCQSDQSTRASRDSVPTRPGLSTIHRHTHRQGHISLFLPLL